MSGKKNPPWFQPLQLCSSCFWSFTSFLFQDRVSGFACGSEQDLSRSSTPVLSQVNQPKFNQRRISSAKFLGELYNYRMVESAVIFRTLFSFISFGINQDGSPSSLDPPEHLFRIRLVCTLLDTCGQYFDRGSSKRKLDCFLIYFQACLSVCHPAFGSGFLNLFLYFRS